MPSVTPGCRNRPCHSWGITRGFSAKRFENPLVRGSCLWRRGGAPSRCAFPLWGKRERGKDADLGLVYYRPEKAGVRRFAACKPICLCRICFLTECCRWDEWGRTPTRREGLASPEDSMPDLDRVNRNAVHGRRSPDWPKQVSEGRFTFRVCL